MVSTCTPCVPIITVPRTKTRCAAGPKSVGIRACHTVVSTKTSVIVNNRPRTIRSARTCRNGFLFSRRRNVVHAARLNVQTRLSLNSPTCVQTTVRLPSRYFGACALYPRVRADLTGPTCRVHCRPFCATGPRQIPHVTFPNRIGCVGRISGVRGALSRLP